MRCGVHVARAPLLWPLILEPTVKEERERVEFYWEKGRFVRPRILIRITLCQEGKKCISMPLLTRMESGNHSSL